MSAEQTFKIDNDEVAKCLRFLMKHVADRQPWGGRPTCGMTSALLQSTIKGKPVKEMVELLAAMFHVGVVAAAYNDAMEGEPFDGEQVAAQMVTFIYTNPERWSKVPGLVHVIRGAADLAATLGVG